MKTTFKLLFMLSFVTTLKSQTLISFNKGDLIGFKDSASKAVKILPQYESKLSYGPTYPKYEFKNGYCVCRKFVKTNGKPEGSLYGIIDKKNTTVIPFKFEEIRETEDPNKYLVYAGGYSLQLKRNMNLDEFNKYCGLKFEKLKWVYIDIKGNVFGYKDE